MYLVKEDFVLGKKIVFHDGLHPLWLIEVDFASERVVLGRYSSSTIVFVIWLLLIIGVIF